MAEFALGLTKAAVEGTLSRVKSAIEEEAKIKEKVQHDLVFITGEFQMMQSFLDVANKERAKNEVVRTWVRQLRDLAFDVEDCVEFVVHLDNKSSWWWRVVPSCVAPPRRMDEAAAEIKLLKDRVLDVSQRNMRYNLISDSGSHSHSHSKTTTPTEMATAKPASAFHDLRQVWDAAWKIRDMGNLQELISREGSDLQVISIWASTRGDLGATSILREAYYDPMICQGFKSRAWVKVVHPFKPEEFLRNLLNRFAPSPRRRYEGLTLGDLKQQLKNQHKYLLVLEQVSTVAEWDDIRMCLPDSQSGSRIIVSTQDLGIALLCTGQPYLVSELRRFSDGQSLCAFSPKISGRRSDMGELKYQIQRGGVTAVVDYDGTKSTFVKWLYQSIMHNKGEDFDCVKFGTQRWVHVAGPLDPDEILRRVLMDLSPYGVYDNKDLDTFLPDLNYLNHDRAMKHIEEVRKMEYQDLIEGCRFLHEEDCLIIIDGLQDKSDWYMIKSVLLSKLTRASSIVVIVGNKSLAIDCVNDQDRVLKSKLGRVIHNRKEEAHGWLKSFKPVRTKVFKLQCYPGVSSVWGIAGVGKSALVRTDYYRLMVSDQFQMYSWADVPDPFNLMDFSRRLLFDFHSDDLQAKETEILGIIEGQDPIQACRKYLSEHKYWVVIDGLRSQNDWDLIKDAFFSGPIKGCVVVITNEASVARHCADEDSRVVNVKCQEPDEAFRLWQQEMRSMPDLYIVKSFPKAILPKCGGLPKIIIALSEYFKSVLDTDNVRRVLLGGYILERMQDGFMINLEKDPRFHGLRGQFSWMQSYFEGCKDSLKPCIFYLSVFSAEDNIKQRRLLMRWIAEGYSRDTSSGTALENGEKLFSELLELSIIQPTSNRSMCQVNGFFHEYIISRPMEDNLVFALEGSCSVNSQRVGQHLAIRSSWDRDKIVFESIDFSRLRSLTVFGKWTSFFISTNTNMRLLRVLDLEGTSGLTNDDLEHIGKLLPRLKFLSIRGCIEITSLPNSVGGLRQLQTLDARHTSIVKLPRAIIKLQKLQYARVGTNKPWDEGCLVTSLPAADEGRIPIPASYHSRPSTSQDGGSTGSRQPATTGSKARNLVSTRLPMLCGRHKLDNNDGVKVPAELGTQLTALHTLGVVNVSDEGGKEILKELKNLTQLRKLGLRGINRENWKEFCSAIPCFRHLETLSVQVDKDKEQGFFCCFGDISNLPKTLKSLKLYGHVEKPMPAWMHKLRDLEKMDLEMTITTQKGMHDIGVFTKHNAFRRLCVKPILDGELRFIFPGRSAFGETYERFSVLEIECTSRLKVTFGPSLSLRGRAEVLKVNCSSGSSLEFSGLEYLKALKEVWLKGSYGDELKQYLLRHIDQLPANRTKPVLKLVQPGLSS